MARTAASMRLIAASIAASVSGPAAGRLRTLTRCLSNPGPTATAWSTATTREPRRSLASPASTPYASPGLRGVRSLARPLASSFVSASRARVESSLASSMSLSE